jgi:predicted kinase
MLVYVSGAPGSGKSTLAGALAAELGYPLLAKDIIKETMHDALGGPAEPDRAWSRRLGAAAMELLWTLAAHAPSAVIEANFRPHHDYELDRIRGLDADPVEVYCHCPPEVAERRYNDRAPSRHPVHVVDTWPATARTEFDRPVGVGRLVTVDTTLPVDVPLVARAVRGAHAGSVSAADARANGAG